MFDTIQPDTDEMRWCDKNVTCLLVCNVYFGLMQTVSLFKKLSVTYSVYSAVFGKYSSKLVLHSEQVVTFLCTMKQMVMTQMVRVMSSEFNKHMRTIQTQKNKKQNIYSHISTCIFNSNKIFLNKLLRSDQGRSLYLWFLVQLCVFCVNCKPYIPEFEPLFSVVASVDVVS